MSSEKQLIEALTTRDDDDEVELNVADALLNIAQAINRLATIHERAQERVAKSAERFEAFVIANTSMNGRPQ